MGVELTVWMSMRWIGCAVRVFILEIRPSKQGISAYEECQIMITDEECKTIIMSMLAANHPDPVPRADMDSVISWARGVATNFAILESVLKGNVLVTWDGEEPSFSLSPKGRKIAVKMKLGDQGESCVHVWSHVIRPLSEKPNRCTLCGVFKEDNNRED